MNRPSRVLASAAYARLNRPGVRLGSTCLSRVGIGLDRLARLELSFEEFVDDQLTFDVVERTLVIVYREEEGIHCTKNNGPDQRVVTRCTDNRPRRDR